MKASILQPILGIITIYLGKADLLRHELKYGDVVRVDGVFKLADIDSANFLLLDEDEVQAAGGVTAEDDIEVRRWIQDEGQFELMSWSAEAINLRCFAHLAE